MALVSLHELDLGLSRDLTFLHKQSTEKLKPAASSSLSLKVQRQFTFLGVIFSGNWTYVQNKKRFLALTFHNKSFSLCFLNNAVKYAVKEKEMPLYHLWLFEIGAC